MIAFAKENNILIIHDNAYSDIIYDGKEGKSFLSFPGAKEVGVEFYSLSKSYNYTGAINAPVEKIGKPGFGKSTISPGLINGSIYCTE